MNGNDYLVKVKANQKNLLQALKDTVDSSMPVDTFKSEEKNRGRHECREVYVYSPLSNIPDGWPSLSGIIYVERDFKSKKEPHHRSKSYYISSQAIYDAGYFAHGIRGHWSIENRLHFVKDVSMNEDNSKIKHVVAASNISIFRNIAINIARQNGLDSIKHASIFFSSNVKKLFKAMKT